MAPRAQRVLSFISQWGGAHKSPFASPPSSPTTSHPPQRPETPPQRDSEDAHHDAIRASQTPPRYNPSRPSSRPTSMALAYQPPLMAAPQDTPAELQPIFAYLNSHSNKLYQEGYFLKLHDLDSRGRPSADRIWNECFAQLVGTILSLWDAAQLDMAGDDGEVVPTFINLTDASIKMIESLPMNGQGGQALQNVLSISTAANNRYLLHFNSLHSLTQWTAGIRLAMYEHATLQEAYTGSILAGKGKYLNNIKSIMERSRFPTEDWTRVRFGAGTPWRRCWCVISPPDEKEIAKAQKPVKKRATYDRSQPSVKGDIKFYESRKVTKKTRPIATITDAFSAYAIYPQSRPLIEQSTLMKVEGLITIHSAPESTTEGFVFVMPETHPAISGFEMMLRWLIPAFDSFGLYGRPQRLIADVIDSRSLMFAMPNNRKYGYLELLDVAGLIHTEGSQKWNEREWRKQLKILTSKRMNSMPSASRTRTSTGLSKGQQSSWSSLNLSNLKAPGLRFGDEQMARSTPASRNGSPPDTPGDIQGRASGTPGNVQYQDGPYNGQRHQRAVSETHKYRNQPQPPSGSSFDHNREEDGSAPPPPPHGGTQRPNYAAYQQNPYNDIPHDLLVDQDFHGPAVPQHGSNNSMPKFEGLSVAESPPVYPVAAPPAFAHKSGERPSVRPNAMPPDVQLGTSAIDQATYAQMSDARQPYAQTRGMQPPPQILQPGMYLHPNSSSQSGRLATIPGTPAAEADQFHLNTPTAQPRRASSNNSISRKPLPGANSYQQQV